MEIERKFLVKSTEYRSKAVPERIAQGYLNSDKNRTVRVRIKGEKAWLTIKSLTRGIERDEFEYEIPRADAEALLLLCEQPVIGKDRFVLEDNGMRWEIDEFLHENAGLIVAEVELPSVSFEITLPSWVGEEVSHDPRYFNANLIKRPFSSWRCEPPALPLDGLASP